MNDTGPCGFYFRVYINDFLYLIFSFILFSTLIFCLPWRYHCFYSTFLWKPCWISFSIMLIEATPGAGVKWNLLSVNLRCVCPITAGYGTPSPHEVNHSRESFIPNTENTSLFRWETAGERGEALLLTSQSSRVLLPVNLRPSWNVNATVSKQHCSWACGNNQPMATPCFQDVCFY